MSVKSRYTITVEGVDLTPVATVAAIVEFFAGKKDERFRVAVRCDRVPKVRRPCAIIRPTPEELAGIPPETHEKVRAMLLRKGFVPGPGVKR